MSPSGRFVAIVRQDIQNWTLWDAASGAVHREGAKHDGTGACICKVTRTGRISVKEECPVEVHSGGLTAVAFSPCGQRFATGDLLGAVILWDAQTEEAVQRMHAVSGTVMSLAFSVEGERLASALINGSICVWDATTGALVRTIPRAHPIYASIVHFSSRENGLLVSAGSDHRIRLWDVESGGMKESFDGFIVAVFSPDGRNIVTTNSEEIQLVDAESGTELVRMVGHGFFVFSAAWC